MPKSQPANPVQPTSYWEEELRLGHMSKTPPENWAQSVGHIPPGYKLLAPLGEGKFGQVYKVRSPGGIRTAALKIIRLSRERLKEFRTLSLIRGIRVHPNLIQYQEVWLQTADGQFLDNADQLEHADDAALDGMSLHIVMELADRSLADLLPDPRAPGGKTTPDIIPGELLRYMGGAARGLDHLHKPIHEAGDGKLAWIIHRDIKPANLLIFGEEVKVADYGVARAYVQDMQATHSIAFTPNYAAPELLSNDLVPASDQYSLAISYYELRTGRMPFKGPAIQAHIRGELNFQGLPEDERAVLHRATHLRVDERFPSCADFVAELQRVVLGTASGVYPVLEPTPSGSVPAPAPRELGRITKSSQGSRTFTALPDRPAASPPPPDVFSGTLLPGASAVPSGFLPVAEEPFAAELNDDQDEPAAPWSRPSRKARKGPWRWVAVAAGCTLIGSGAAVTYWLKPGPQLTPVTTDSKSKPQTEPPREAPDYQRILADARAAFRDGRYADATTALDGLLVAETPPEIRQTAGVLRKAWEQARLDVLNPNPSPADRDRFKHLAGAAAPDGADDQAYGEVIRAVYRGLVEKVDDAEARLKAARALLTHDTFPDGLAALDALIGRGGPPEVLQTAGLLKKNWEQFRADRDAVEKAKRKPTMPERAQLTRQAETAGDGLASADVKPLRDAYDRLLKSLEPEVPDSEKLDRARAEFRADRIDSGLELLKTIPGPQADALRKAWEAARGLAAKLDATADPGDVVKACQGAAAPAKNVSPSDAEPLTRFYADLLPKLVRRLVTDPDPKADWDKPTWTALRDALARVKSPSPWPPLLRVESELVVKHVHGDPFPVSGLPAAKPDPDKVLAAYREFVAAGHEWYTASTGGTDNDRRKAGSRLVGAVADDDAKKLLTPTRSRLAAYILNEAAGAFRPASPPPDRPFGDSKDVTADIRQWLAAATGLLDDKDDRTPEVRARLVQAAAFPTPDRKLADRAMGADSPDQLAKVLAEAGERTSFWMAYARTRDLGAAGGVAAAVDGFARVAEDVLKDPDQLDPAFATRFCSLLADKEFATPVRQVGTADVKKKAAEALYARLARVLFQRRVLHRPAGGQPAGSPAAVADDLAAAAAGLVDANEAGVHALAGVIHLEVASDDDRRDAAKLDGHEAKAERLKNRDPQAALPLAYFGLVRYLKAEATDPTDRSRFDQFVGAEKVLAEAATQAEQADDAVLLPLLYQFAAIANINLANAGANKPDQTRARLQRAVEFADKMIQRLPKEPLAWDIKGAALEDQAWLPTNRTDKERKALYDGAVKAFLQATAGDAATSAFHTHALLHLGRCRYKWANHFPDDVKPHDLLGNAEANLDTVHRLGRDDDKPQSLYWLAMVQLTRAGVAWPVGGTTALPEELLADREKPLDGAALKKADEHLAALLSLPAGGRDTARSWYRKSGREWQACLACYRAGIASTGRPAARAEALKRLDELAEVAPVPAAAHRARFLFSQLERASKAAAEDELKDVWRDLTATPDPAPKNSYDRRYQLSLYGVLAQARVLAVKHALPDPEGAEAYVKKLAALAASDPAAKTQVAIKLEYLGQIFAHKVAVNEDKEKMVGPAAAAFAAVEKVDRDLNHLAEAKWNPVHAADYREHIGVALEAGKKPEQAVAMYEQSIKLRSKLTGQEDKIKTLRQQVEKLAGMKN